MLALGLSCMGKCEIQHPAAEKQPCPAHINGYVLDFNVEKFCPDSMPQSLIRCAFDRLAAAGFEDGAAGRISFLRAKLQQRQAAVPKAKAEQQPVPALVAFEEASLKVKQLPDSEIAQHVCAELGAVRSQDVCTFISNWSAWVACHEIYARQAIQVAEVQLSVATSYRDACRKRLARRTDVSQATAASLDIVKQALEEH